MDLERWTDRDVDRPYLCPRCRDIWIYCECEEDDEWEDELAIDIALEDRAFRGRK